MCERKMWKLQMVEISGGEKAVSQGRSIAQSYANKVFSVDRYRLFTSFSMDNFVIFYILYQIYFFPL